MKIFWRLFLLFLFTFFLLTIFKTQIHKLKPQMEIPGEIKVEMIKLASFSLKNQDVPVGAIMVYNNKIIGKGYNTIRKENIASGHAEINAVNEALKTYGYDKFMVLDRTKLYLYSTFEPCEMCMGALQHYNINQLVYMKDKSLFHWWKNQSKSWYYEMMKRKANGEEIQDSLFFQHPKYPGK